jgi:antitoxin VapB
MVEMAMNIKSAEAHKLATELARRTGKTITEAVTVALRDALARLKRDDDAKLDQLLKEMRELYNATDGINEDDLYDPETGLPA